MTIDREALREKVARAICRVEYEDPDKEVIGGQAQAFYNYGPRWRAASNGCLGETDYLAMADAALSALDQPAQEPVLWITQAELDSLRRAGVRGYYGFISLIARKDRDDKYSIPLYAAPQPTKIPYSKDAQNAVMTLLEQGKVYVDNQGYLSLVKGDVDVVMDTIHPKA